MSVSEESANRPNEDSVLESFVSQGGGLLVSRIVAFLGTAYLARTLGTYAFGIIGFATAITTFLALPLRAGFEPVGAREVARDRASASELAAAVSLLRFSLALLALGVLAIVALVLDKPFEVRQVVFLMGLTLLPVALDPAWVYRGMARNRRVGLSMILAQGVYVLTLLWTVQSPAQVFWVPLALALGEGTAAVYLSLPLLRIWTRGIEWRRAWGVFRSSGFLIWSGLLDALIRTTDIVLIAVLLGEVQTGLYSAAYRVCFLIMGIAVTLHWTYLPRLARIAPGDSALMNKLVARALEAGGSLAVPFVVGGWILATPLLAGLFGPEYTAGRDAFRFLLIAMGLFFLHGFHFQVLVVFDRTRPELAIRGTAAGLNLLLNLTLIPLLGIAGAAIATVAAELVILVWRWAVCRGLGIEIGPRVLWKPLTAAAGMGAILLWLTPKIGWLISGGVGGLLYLALLALLRGFPRDFRPTRSPRD